MVSNESQHEIAFCSGSWNRQPDSGRNRWLSQAPATSGDRKSQKGNVSDGSSSHLEPNNYKIYTVVDEMVVIVGDSKCFCISFWLKFGVRVFGCSPQIALSFHWFLRGNRWPSKPWGVWARTTPGGEHALQVMFYVSMNTCRMARTGPTCWWGVGVARLQWRLVKQVVYLESFMDV